ncbi:hypothetical protein PCH_Pc22g23090 [Penicillium rubens Wisconsin 54-1255]|uniref:Uncharacterized protein n=1 Tax=Penicillium rubens (strain ATCC 28089 / DSM 1075 / NRRL 1951 / Wisconsin 54-1255) TaxID=500485 RepID=B6HVF6_PENRW|nr:hypothetical protein PCH_Pc22g23090 [Penicillium rubens Wisconsin 54-1255]
MASQISPNQTGIDVAERLVNSSENPNSCPCGWYVYYSAVCGHVYQEVKHQCGAFQSVKYESGNKTRASARGCADQRQVPALLISVFNEVWEAMRGSFQGLYTGVPGVWRILVAAYCIIYSNRLSKNSKVVHWMVNYYVPIKP